MVRLNFFSIGVYAFFCFLRCDAGAGCFGRDGERRGGGFLPLPPEGAGHGGVGLVVQEQRVGTCGAEVSEGEGLSADQGGVVELERVTLADILVVEGEVERQVELRRTAQGVGQGAEVAPVGLVVDGGSPVHVE